MNLTFKENVNLFIWLSVFTVLGPVLSAIYLNLYTGWFTPKLRIDLFFDFLILSIFLAWIPAFITGFVIYKLRRKIIGIFSLITVCSTGGINAIGWYLVVFSQYQLNEIFFFFILGLFASLTVLLFFIKIDKQ